jgi:gentisate 1,2-dioxygenase
MSPTGYYGKDGVMTQGWDSEEEALKEFAEFYNTEEFEGCEVIFYNEYWVIAYN